MGASKRDFQELIQEYYSLEEMYYHTLKNEYFDSVTIGSKDK
jgi:hypothetical protein